MGAAPHDPPAPGGADHGDPSELSAEVTPVGSTERYGPLAVRRFTKVDGRALILYERAAPGGDTA
jgi:hypothetical protein